jgi:hypothetical protein
MPEALGGIQHMNHRHHRARVIAIGVILSAAAAFGLAGCTSDADTPSSLEGLQSQPSEEMSPTPSVDPAQAVIDERAAAAEERYLEAMDIADEYAGKGETPFWELNDKGYISGSFADDQQTFWDYFVSEGRKRVGERDVLSIEVTDYEGSVTDEDYTGHRVHLTVCTDRSKVEVLDAEGNPIPGDGAATVSALVKMQGQPGGHWSIASVENLGSGC